MLCYYIMVLNLSFRKKRSYNRSLPSRKKLNKLPSKHNSKSKSNRKSIKNKIVKRKKYNKKNKKGGSAVNVPVVNPVTRIGSDDIQITKEPLGGGQYGDVLKGSYRIPVAIKRCKGGDTNDTCITVDLPQEITIMTQLGDHPNIVKMWGMSYISDNVPIAVLELCNMGSLDTHLSKKSKNNETVYSQIKQILLNIVSGMQHIHSKNIVHRDLAARNVLLSGNDDFTNITAKVGDFGLAKQMTQGKYQWMPHLVGGDIPLRWTSHNSIINNIFGEQSDIWSYGCLCVEILLFGRDPYPLLSSVEEIVTVLRQYNTTNNLEDFFLNIFGTSDYTNIPLWNHFNAILPVCFRGDSSTTFTELAGVVNKFPLASAVPGAPDDSHFTAFNPPDYSNYTAFDQALAAEEKKNRTLYSVQTVETDSGHIGNFLKGDKSAALAALETPGSAALAVLETPGIDL